MKKIAQKIQNKKELFFIDPSKKKQPFNMQTKGAISFLGDSPEI